MPIPGPPGYSICNLLRTLAPTLSASAEDTAFPLSNLRDNRVGTVSKLNFSTGSWLVEFASPPPVSFVAIPNHGFPSDATVVLQSGATTSTATIDTFDLTDCIANGAGEAWLTFPTVTTDRFWRILVLAAGTTPYNARLGELWIGEITTLSRPGKWGFERSRAYSTQGVVSEGGVDTRYSLTNRRRWDMDMRDHMELAQKTELDRMARAFRGGGSPGLFIPDVDVGNEVALVRWSNPGPTHSTEVIDHSNEVRYSGLGVHVIEEGFERVNPRS